jgi:hypothetical protein
MQVAGLHESGGRLEEEGIELGKNREKYRGRMDTAAGLFLIIVC